MRNPIFPSFLAALLACAALFAPRDAGAFCRKRTVPAVFPNGAGAEPCPSEGLFLYHPSQCILYRLSKRESGVIPNAVLSDALARAFAIWAAPNPTCVPGFTAIELAPADVPVGESYSYGANLNIVLVRDDKWPHDQRDSHMSITTLTFNSNSGEILDADMEVNGADENLRWSLTPTPPGTPIANGSYDLYAIMLHEVGHFLGLEHSKDEEAAMYASYTPGTTDPHALAADDQAGICAAFPSRDQRMTSAGPKPATACNFRLQNPDATCEADITHGCAAAPTTPGDIFLSLTSLGIASALGAIRRRRSFL